MNCPECGHPVTSVETTRRRGEGKRGVMVRYRKCCKPGCHTEFTTIEARDGVNVAVLDEITRVQRELRSILSTLEHIS